MIPSSTLFVNIFTGMDTPYYVKNRITGFCGRQYSDNLFISIFSRFDGGVS